MKFKVMFNFSVATDVFWQKGNGQNHPGVTGQSIPRPDYTRG